MVVVVGVWWNRSPCFDRVVLPLLRRVESTLNHVPGVGSLYGKLLEIVVALS